MNELFRIGLERLKQIAIKEIKNFGRFCFIDLTHITCKCLQQEHVSCQLISHVGIELHAFQGAQVLI